MKTICSLTIPRTVLAISSLLAIPAFAGALADEFTAADIDVSAELSESEFSTAFSSGLSKGRLKKQFKAADSDRDRSISLEEYLAFRAAAILKNPKADPALKFEVADADVDGFLTLDEFAILLPGKKPLIEFRKRFLMADADDDNLVTFEEWEDYLASAQPDTSGIPYRKFDLADLDADDELTVDEFANAFPPAVKPTVIQKKFDGQDDNDDGVLTREEWNPGGSKAL